MKCNKYNTFVLPKAAHKQCTTVSLGHQKPSKPNQGNGVAHSQQISSYYLNSLLVEL